MTSLYGPQMPLTNTASLDMARWQVDVPATAASRVKAWLASFAAAASA